MKLNFFSAIASNERIDKESGVIFGVSVITAGPAAGHNLTIDDASLQQILGLCKQFKDGLKVRLNHPVRGSGAPVQSIIGALKNFRIESDKVKADLHLLKSDEYFSKVLEMSEKIPSEFGLSIAYSPISDTGDEGYIRVSEIYACDLVDAPAANPSGLFSEKDDDEMCEHCGKTEELCSCSNYSPKTKTKSMSNAIAKALGLAKDATEEQIAAELSKRLVPTQAVDLTEINKKIETLSAMQKNVEDLQAKQNAGIQLAKKAEIDALLVEASKEGKIVPFENDDLYTIKDGEVTIKTEPAMLRKVISKLEKNQVHLSKTITATELPKNKDGIRLKGEELIEFCRAKREEGAKQLNRMFADMNKQSN